MGATQATPGSPLPTAGAITIIPLVAATMAAVSPTVLLTLAIAAVPLEPAVAMVSFVTIPSVQFAAVV